MPSLGRARVSRRRKNNSHGSYGKHVQSMSCSSDTDKDCYRGKKPLGPFTSKRNQTIKKRNSRELLLQGNQDSSDSSPDDLPVNKHQINCQRSSGVLLPPDGKGSSREQTVGASLKPREVSQRSLNSPKSRNKKKHRHYQQQHDCQNRHSQHTMTLHNSPLPRIRADNDGSKAKQSQYRRKNPFGMVTSPSLEHFNFSAEFFDRCMLQFDRRRFL